MHKSAALQINEQNWSEQATSADIEVAPNNSVVESFKISIKLSLVIADLHL